MAQQEYDVSNEELNVLLCTLATSGQLHEDPSRAVVVATLVEKKIVGASVHYGRPQQLPGLADAAFAKKIRRVWKTYDRAKEIPVIVTHTAPAPFVGLKLAGLPWAN